MCMERVGKPEGNDGWAVVEALTQSLVHEQWREDGVASKVHLSVHRHLKSKESLLQIRQLYIQIH